MEKRVRACLSYEKAAMSCGKDVSVVKKLQVFGWNNMRPTPIPLSPLKEHLSISRNPKAINRVQGAAKIVLSESSSDFTSLVGILLSVCRSTF